MSSQSHSSPTDIPAPLLPLLQLLSSVFLTLQSTFKRIPGSPIIVRYIKSSYQDDPWRSLLEVLLIAFAVRTLLMGRTRGEGAGKNFIKLTEKVSDCDSSAGCSLSVGRDVSFEDVRAKRVQAGCRPGAGVEWLCT